MTSKQIVGKLIDCKGQHVPAKWQRTLKTLKNVTASGVVITKETTAFVRAGIDYANLKSVREGIAEGTRGEVEPLPWGEWVEFPFIIRHMPKGAKAPLDYVRLYPAVFGNLAAKMEVAYFLNGQPATKEQVEPLCLASEFRDDDKPVECFTLRAESILTIG